MNECSISNKQEELEAVMVWALTRAPTHFVDTQLTQTFTLAELWWYLHFDWIKETEELHG